MVDRPAKILRNIFFTKTTSGRSAGEEFLQRLQLRDANRDTPASEATVNAQAKAIITYGYEKDAAYNQLLNIKAACLIVK